MQKLKIIIPMNGVLKQLWLLKIKMSKKGLFIVLEGIDGSGTTTQIDFLHRYIKGLSKYNDVLTTHEPWKSDEIKRILKEDKDAYSDGEKLTELYIKDRERHVRSLIIPNMLTEVIILCDRYSLSTFSYQGVQGIDFETIRRIHNQTGIIKPDLTFFLDVNYETAKRRIEQRGEVLEKFEKDEEFTKKLIEGYRDLTQKENLFGKIIKINGNNPIEKVTQNITEEFKRYQNNFR